MSYLLIVDDQEVVRKGIIKMLHEFDLKIDSILEAENGQEALDISEKHDIDIILVDIMMPKMDGLALVEKLNQRGSKAHIIIVSAYDDFEFAKKAISLKVDSYILKPITRKELYQAITAALDKITSEHSSRQQAKEQQRKYDYMLLYEYLKSRDISINLESLFDNLGFSGFSQQNFRIAVAASSGTHTIDINYFKNILQKRLSDKNIEHLIFATIEESIVIILNLKSPSSDFPVFIDDIDGMIFGVSESTDRLVKLPELFTQAEAALSECRFKGVRKLSYSEMKNEETIVLGVSEYEGIVRAVRQNIKDEADRSLDDAFYKLSISNMSFENIKNSLKNLMHYVHINLMDSYPEFEISADYRQKFKKTENFLGLKAVVKEEIDRLYDFARQKETMDIVSPAIKDVLIYIAENFDKDLSLAYIANKLDMNYNYLSALFTKIIGVSFTKYVLKYRLEKARELLKSGRYMVKEVSGLVGFNDYKYFCKVYKKHFNITPSETV